MTTRPDFWWTHPRTGDFSNSSCLGFFEVANEMHNFKTKLPERIDNDYISEINRKPNTRLEEQGAIRLIKIECEKTFSIY